jgi:hypothetical protein
MIGNDVASENWEEKKQNKTKTPSLPEIIVFS